MTSVIRAPSASSSPPVRTWAPMTGYRASPVAQDLVGVAVHLLDRDGEADADVARRLAPRVPPVVAMAELTPTTSPARLTSGPPELPGLIAASVCTALMYDDSLSESPVVTGRLRALTMPAVTVWLRPSGRAEGDDRVADVEDGGRPEGGRDEGPRALDLEDREVVDRAAPDHGGVVPVALRVDDLDRAVVLGRGRDHVVVGDDVPLAVEDEARAGRAAVLAVEGGDDLHGAGQQRLGDRRRPSRCRPPRGRVLGLDGVEPALVATGVVAEPVVAERPRTRRTGPRPGPGSRRPSESARPRRRSSSGRRAVEPSAVTGEEAAEAGRAGPALPVPTTAAGSGTGVRVPRGGAGRSATAAWGGGGPRRRGTPAKRGAGGAAAGQAGCVGGVQPEMGWAAPPRRRRQPRAVGRAARLAVVRVLLVAHGALSPRAHTVERVAHGAGPSWSWTPVGSRPGRSTPASARGCGAAPGGTVLRVGMGRGHRPVEVADRGPALDLGCPGGAQRGTPTTAAPAAPPPINARPR